MIKTERNFQIELLAFFVNLFLIFYLKLTFTDAALILLASVAVLSAEIFNTAIERYATSFNLILIKESALLRTLQPVPLYLLPLPLQLLEFLCIGSIFFNHPVKSLIWQSSRGGEYYVFNSKGCQDRRLCFLNFISLQLKYQLLHRKDFVLFHHTFQNQL
ncbi:diacylglycerol kinase [Chryseobacterium tructae]|nr:diacylglycerol kinase [Chryseobacterium tructae]MDN3692638.1 diacylglycerol kinase [Chryseobacterium tructae]